MASGEPLPDTLNATWKNNKSRFGYKMLQKMGWSEEKGLGKNESGTVDAIKLKKREEGVGLGVEKMTDGAGARGWSQTANGFSSVLDSLKATYGSRKSKSKSKSKDKDNDNDKDKDGKKSKKKEKKEKRKDEGDVDEGKTVAAASLRIQVGMKYVSHSYDRCYRSMTITALSTILSYLRLPMSGDYSTTSHRDLAYVFFFCMLLLFFVYPSYPLNFLLTLQIQEALSCQVVIQ